MRAFWSASYHEARTMPANLRYPAVLMTDCSPIRKYLLNRALTFNQLKWVTVLAPLVFLVLLGALARFAGGAFFGTWTGIALFGLMSLVAIFLFSMTIFRFLGNMQRQLELQNQELLALHQASLAISRHLDLHAVLQGVVDEARDLFAAHYGALSYLRDDGTVEAFLTSGMPQDARQVIGPEPVGHGVLGVVLNEGESLRLDRISDHPQAVGFPPLHPYMITLLAVPIRTSSIVLGNLYIADRENMVPFTARDEETLQRFAAIGAIAIENARLHVQVAALATTQERERIAREMHDSLAQVLGYVNTKAQATQVLLGSGQVERADDNLRQMVDASRAAYDDVREGILSLRTSLDEGRGFIDALQDYLVPWQDQSGVRAALDADMSVQGRLTPLREVQLLRIVQEALANVRKHAVATGAVVSIRMQEGFVVAAIEDDGVGLLLNGVAGSGLPRFGLSTMRERAESVGGTLDITSSPNQGTRVTVRLPAER